MRRFACFRAIVLAFFLAGEQAMLEALVLEQAAHLPIDPRERDSALTELYYTVRTMARREVDAFCSVCQFKNSANFAHNHAHHAHAVPGPEQPAQAAVRVG